MEVKMSRLFFAAFLLLASPLFAVPGVKSPIRLKTTSPRWDGRCPHEFHFAGTITSRGAGDVQFTWDRSDGASAPVETIHFTGPNQTRTVKTSWTLSQTYSGWEQIRVTSPNFIRSNKAGFTLRCR
jgi:hypothetical protein